MKTVPITGIVGVAALREAAATEIRQVLNLVSAALDKKWPNEYVGLEAAWPDHVVCRRGGRYWSLTYTLTADNQVELGEPVEVVETYTPVREAQADRAGVFVESTDEPGRFRIRVIRAGLSGNRNYYPDAVLREAVALFNGVRVFQKSDEQHLKGGGKDFGQLIGGLSNAAFVEGTAPDTGEVQADLTLLEPDGTTATKLREAVSRHLTGLFGFSVDALGVTRKEIREGKPVQVARSLKRVKSVDLIVEPGAGGELISLIEAVDPQKEEIMNREQLLGILKARAPKTYAKLGANATDDEIEAAFKEALGDPDESSGGAGADPRIDQLEAKMTELREATEFSLVRESAQNKIRMSKLPPAAQDKLLKQFAGLHRFTEAQVTQAIIDEREYLAKFVESGKVTGLGGLDIEVGDRSVAISEMLDAYFDPGHKNHKDVRSFKEAYIEITGDRDVTGIMRECNQARMRESLGRFAEAMDSTSFAQALGDAVTRRMQAIYTGMTDLQTWRNICDVVPVSDFRQQHLTRIGGYGNLPTVGEGGPYSALSSPGDDEATYVVAKRGGTESITLEMIKNDDRRVIPQIPRELALAAANTLYEFVFDIPRTNPVVWDGVALFHATHGNLFTGELTSTEFSAHRLAMLKQVRSGSGKRLNTPPGVVLVPFELEETAFNLFVRNTNLDANFVQRQRPQVIVVSYWTDTTDFVTVADPNIFRPIEVGFLDGREDPELFVQDSPTVGSLFSNDKLTYKIRHIYGSTVKVDGEKAMTKGVVP